LWWVVIVVDVVGVLLDQYVDRYVVVAVVDSVVLVLVLVLDELCFVFRSSCWVFNSGDDDDDDDEDNEDNDNSY